MTEPSLFAMMKAQHVVPGRVSVIVPVYQGERFILGAIRSALRQTYANIEILVIDDGSTDGTAALLAGVSDPRVSVLRQANNGLCAARNLALANATGEYVAFLDADDRWFPDKLAMEVATLRDAPDPVGIAYSWYYAVDDRGRLLHRSRPHEHAGDAFSIMLRSDDFMLPSASLFHRRIFETIGGFEIGSYFEDRALFLRAGKAFPVWPTRRRLAIYRQTLEGKGRRILADFALARHESLAILDSLRPLLTLEEAEVLRAQQLRSLYFRLLMYGFEESAARIRPEVQVTPLAHGAKGCLAWLHAKSGINLMRPLRVLVQQTNRAFGQRSWRRLLSRKAVMLHYS